MTNEEMPDEFFIGYEGKHLKMYTFVDPDNCKIPYERYVRADQAPVDVEQLIKEVDENTKYTTLDGVGYVIDYLASKGHLRTPPDNSEALEALNWIVTNGTFTEDQTETLNAMFQTIMTALGGNDE